MTALHKVDWFVILGYFLIVFGIAWWAYLKEKRSQTTTEYFLAGRNLAWWIIGAAVFSSNIGSEHLVGLAGSGATDGVAMAHYELHAWCLLVLAWVLVPFYMRSRSLPCRNSLRDGSHLLTAPSSRSFRWSHMFSRSWRLVSSQAVWSSP